MEYYLYLFGAILLTALGQLFYKLYSIKKSLFLMVLTVVFFLTAPVLSYLSLKGLTIDVVYMMTSLTILLVVVFSKVFLSEKIDSRTYLGIILIIIGVVLYEL